MAPRRSAKIAGYVLALLMVEPLGWHAGAQTAVDEPALTFSRVESLGLPPEKASQLQKALEIHDYISAEKLLLPEIESDPHSIRAANLLAFIGGVYFLNHDYLNAAIAWNKSQAITRLQPSLQFSLAMAYIHMGHSDWARTVLESLAKQDPKDADYPYWLGRLDYDAQSYNDAINHFKDAVRLAPEMARAYDNLGLCYYQQNQNALAVESYRKAIDLDRSSPHPSAWPYLNLAITLELMDQSKQAETNLRAAIQLDPKFAEAHFQLGNVLERMGQANAAVGEFRDAANLDPNYAEPHYALARMYRKLGQESAAREEVQTYVRLHSRSKTGDPPPKTLP